MFTTLSEKFQVYGVTWLRFNNSKEVCVLIEVRDLVKQYGNRLAVDHLSFTVPDGQIFGFLGPNGAGKSTTMNLMTGYLGPTSGEILVDGFSVTKEPEKAKRCIGYLPELPPLYMDMTVDEYLRFAAQLKKVPKSEREAQVDRVAEMTGVDQVLGRLIRNLSKGYRQRVGLAQALLGFPKVLILDADCCAFRLESAAGEDLREAVFQTCARQGLPLLELRRDTLTLEDIFLKLTSDDVEEEQGEEKEAAQ